MRSNQRKVLITVRYVQQNCSVLRASPRCTVSLAVNFSSLTHYTTYFITNLTSEYGMR